jgi:hypothetical protein
MEQMNNQWPELKANPHCCEEASLSSHAFYIPCNAPAVNIVGWIGRDDKPIRMCQHCSNHNVSNRGGYVVEMYKPSDAWGNQVWGSVTSPAELKSLNPWDSMNEDALLLLWADKKAAIEKAKAEEMDLRKYIVGREFPKKNEGTNRKELGGGYDLKAVVKYNYNLADNDTVEATLDKISKLGNAGSAIADRLVSWKPNFLLGEYRQLQEDKEKGSQFANEALSIINEMLTITEGAPTLEIIAPKAKKK